MPSPNAVSAANVNTELGVGSTTQLSWGNNHVRNVTTQYTGTNSEVNGSKMRWGINFPGAEYFNGIFTTNYDLNSTLIISAQEIVFYDGFTYAQGYSEIKFFANGVMRFDTATAAGGSAYYHKTWLTSGAAGDYTVQFQRTAGDALTGSSSASNTDLAMSTDRFFALFTGTIGPGVDAEQKITFGNLIIKDSGGTLITRPIELSVAAEVV
jgi:hypothetical protein